MARRRLKALRYPKDVVNAVSLLTELHLRFHGYRVGRGGAGDSRSGASAWTDSAVRRYVTDAGDQLERLHKLVRSDCTTRNRRRAAALAAAYDDLEARIAELAEQEELGRIRPDLSGDDIMRLLDIPPGPLVGKAYRHLLGVRMERGPLPREQAEAELLRWAQGQGLDRPA
jgi:poly(A) polymerase